MNYQALINQAAKLAESQQYAELEVICQKILKKKPKHFDALQLLGLAQSRTDQLNDAISNLKRARKLNPQHASVRINLANACLDKGQTEDAIKFSREAIKIDASNFTSHLALGNALQIRKIYPEAEQSYERALQLNHASAEARDSLGECYKKQGNLSGAINLFIEANELSPALTTVYIHLLQTLLLMHITDDAVKAANAGLTLDNLSASDAYELWIGKAKIAWITGDLEAAWEALKQSDKIVGLNMAYGNIGNLEAYRNCLKKLLEEREIHPQLYQGEPEQAIFFVAESHALAPSEVVVSYEGATLRLLSTLITGCKAWHLANKVTNEYKASLESLFSALPLKSIIVLGFGEIDCRISEGILKASHEKNIDIRKSINVIIDDYLAFALTLSEPYQHRIIIYGVPAPNMDFVSTQKKEHQAQLCEVIQTFNQKLRDSCEVHNLSFLDVYRLTTDSSGNSNQKYHIDARHLHPKIFPMLFDEL
jgi:tetratricopeptide (TPR) repeat protein